MKLNELAGMNAAITEPVSVSILNYLLRPMLPLPATWSGQQDQEYLAKFNTTTHDPTLRGMVLAVCEAYDSLEQTVNAIVAEHIGRKCIYSLRGSLPAKLDLLERQHTLRALGVAKLNCVPLYITAVRAALKDYERVVQAYFFGQEIWSRPLVDLWARLRDAEELLDEAFAPHKPSPIQKDVSDNAV